MLINTKNTRTGLYAQYPKHFLALFPDLIECDEDQTCTDCVVQLEVEPEPEPVDLKEPTPKRTKK